jgi:hypothetical protein
MCIVMGADTALNSQPAASPGRWLQLDKRLIEGRLTTIEIFMRRLFTCILFTAFVSCDHGNSSINANANDSVDPEISDNKDIAGSWTMCATSSNGLAIQKNVCPTIIFIGNGSGYVEMGSEITEHFIWTLKKSILEVNYESKSSDQTFPDTTYIANFSRENGSRLLTLNHGSYQCYLR